MFVFDSFMTKNIFKEDNSYRTFIFKKIYLIEIIICDLSSHKGFYLACIFLNKIINMKWFKPYQTTYNQKEIRKNMHL